MSSNQNMKQLKIIKIQYYCTRIYTLKTNNKNHKGFLLIITKNKFYK